MENITGYTPGPWKGKPYMCYDGVDGDVTYHQSEAEALGMLKHYIDNGLNDGEWMDGISDCFIARITHHVKEKEIEAPEEYKREGVNRFIEMEIAVAPDMAERIRELEAQNAAIISTLKMAKENLPFCKMCYKKRCVDCKVAGLINSAIETVEGRPIEEVLK